MFYFRAPKTQQPKNKKEENSASETNKTSGKS